MPVLTERYIKALAKEPAPAGVVLYVDEHRDAPKGFCLRRTPSGAMAYVLRFRVKGAHLERKMTVAAIEDMTLADARDEAAHLRKLAREGFDPMAEREARGAQAKAEYEAATVEMMLKRFLADHVEGLRPASQRDYRSCINRHILPALGKYKAKDVTPTMVKQMLAKIKSTASKARALRILSSAFNVAINDEWEMADSNPCKRVKMPTIERRKRRLDKQEMARFVAALDKLENDPRAFQTVRLCRLLILTGARRGETMQAKWADFNLERGTWIKPAHTTKTKTTHEVPLSAEAVGVLKTMREHPLPAGGVRYGKRREAIEVREASLRASPFLFPSLTDPDRPMQEPKRAWRSVVEEAGLPDLKVHDLRRSFISAVVSAGLSLETAGALAGHTRAETTRGYLYMLDDALRDGAAAVGKLYGAGR